MHLIKAAHFPLDSEAALPTSIVWMPAGKSAINAGLAGGGTFSGTVVCDEQACRAIIASFEKLTAEGRRVWCDFDHADGAAAAWVSGFYWNPMKGIMANLRWTAEGSRALREKSFFSFSPAFQCERKTGRVVGLLPGKACGGLVNCPAFQEMPALVAAKYSEPDHSSDEYLRELGNLYVAAKRHGSSASKIQNEILTKIAEATRS